MAKSELVGVISDLTKQVEQLKKSIEQQYSMDQQLQQNQVIYMDQNGQLILGSLDSGTLNNDLPRQVPPSNNDAAHLLLKQFLLSTSSPPPPPQQQQQAPRPMDEPDAQQQNKKAYEKNYYSLD
ncbi:unnamed protein product [Absidia cylindrospora]